MKLSILLTAVCLITACGQSSGGGAPSDPAINSANQPQYQPPMDTRNKTQCGALSNCAAVCNFEYPYVSDDDMKNHVCLFGLPCTSIILQEESASKLANQDCLSASAYQVTSDSQMSGSSCGSDAGCALYCEKTYPYVTDESILRAANPGGLSSAVETPLFQNHIAMAKYEACLAVTRTFVY